ncbi:MAG: glutaredoxin [Rhodothermales bacterium]|jgi:glutaredoxin
MMNLIRNGLGAVLSGVSRLTLPKPMTRTAEQQARINEELQSLLIYQFGGCPFCIKVRRVAHRLGLPIEYRDASRGSEYRDELEREGGKSQVPCLRIEEGDAVTWLYESGDVIDYLEKRFG